MIGKPTRITPTSATILDQIITNTQNFVKEVDILPPVSANDHCTVSAYLDFKIKKEPCYMRQIWKYEQADVNSLRIAIVNSDFNQAFTSRDVNHVCKVWTESLLNIAKAHIPNKMALIRPQDSP